jgi:hypothetical protein
MRDMPLLPQEGTEVNRGIDREVRLSSPHPGSRIVDAHDRSEAKRRAVKRGLQRLAVSGIENFEGTVVVIHVRT